MSWQFTHGSPVGGPNVNSNPVGWRISQYEQTPTSQSHEGGSGSEIGGFAKAIMLSLYRTTGE